MALASIDPNVWYNLVSQATGYNLNYDLTAVSRAEPVLFLGQHQQNWQFVNPGIVGGGDASGVWLMRPQGSLDHCVDFSTGSLRLVQCQSSVSVWDIRYDANTTASTIYNSDLGYLAIGCAERTVHISSCPSILDGQASIAWAIEPVSAINDDSHSVLSFSPSATLGSTTASITPAPTRHIELRQADPNSPSTVVNTRYSTDIVNKNFKDLPSPLPALIPKNTNFGCENCKLDTTFDISVTGYNDDDDSTLEELSSFQENGAIDILISSLDADVTFDVQLLPGYQPVNTFFSFFSVSKSVNVTRAISLNIVFEFGIPFIIQLDSAVTIIGGFTVSIDQASLHLDLGSIEDSTSSGFDSATFNAKKFHVSAPNLEISMLTGIAYRTTVSANIAGDDFGTSGSLTLDAYLPRLNTTGAIRNNVDDNCNSASSGGMIHADAIELSLDADTAVVGSNALNFLYDGESRFQIKGSAFPTLSYPINSTSVCLFDDSLKADFLADGGGGNGAGNTKPWWGFICAALLASWYLVWV